MTIQSRNVVGCQSNRHKSGLVPGSMKQKATSFRLCIPPWGYKIRIGRTTKNSGQCCSRFCLISFRCDLRIKLNLAQLYII
jgi:hypothetical protein